MTRRISGLWLALAALVLHVLACSNNPSPEEVQMRGELGRSCHTNPLRCEATECVDLGRQQPDGGESICTVPCESDDDCQSDEYSLECGIGPGGNEYCMHSCASVEDFGGVCIDGVPTACGAADDAYCANCGCPSGQFCNGDSCRDKADIGESCEDDDECKSTNCSPFRNVCLVPILSPCDSDNCDRCVSDGSWSYCSQECSSDADCNGGECLGYRGYYVCYMPCRGANDESCPGTCEQIGDTFVSYYCDMCDDCFVTHYPRRAGTYCYSDSHCESDECYVSRLCSDNYCTYPRGICSARCESNDECPDGTTCAIVPCRELYESTSTCGKRCLPGCDEGSGCRSCRQLDDVEGNEVDVCDVKRDDGGYCESDSDCISQYCRGERCAPSSDLENGTICRENSDCLSGICNGTCRGTALLGDPCGVGDDCAVGQCCAGACAESCG